MGMALFDRSELFGPFAQRNPVKRFGGNSLRCLPFPIYLDGDCANISRVGFDTKCGFTAFSPKLAQRFTGIMMLKQFDPLFRGDAREFHTQGCAKGVNVGWFTYCKLLFQLAPAAGRRLAIEAAVRAVVIIVNDIELQNSGQIFIVQSCAFLRRIVAARNRIVKRTPA